MKQKYFYPVLLVFILLLANSFVFAQDPLISKNAIQSRYPANFSILENISAIFTVIIFLFIGGLMIAYRNKELFKMDKYKIVVFTVILLLSNIPSIGTTNPLGSSCQYACTNSLDSSCSQTCHHTFESRAIFWWPWQQMDTSITYLSYSKTGDIYESIINTHSIPMLRGFKQIVTYPRITDIIGLILTITYFYFVSCGLIYLYNRLKTKTGSGT